MFKSTIISTALLLITIAAAIVEVSIAKSTQLATVECIIMFVAWFVLSCLMAFAIALYEAKY